MGDFLYQIEMVAVQLYDMGDVQLCEVALCSCM